MPTAMETIVIVITSSGIPPSPITPSTINEESRLGKIAMTAIFTERKSSKNIAVKARTV